MNDPDNKFHGARLFMVLSFSFFFMGVSQLISFMNLRLSKQND